MVIAKVGPQDKHSCQVSDGDLICGQRSPESGQLGRIVAHWTCQTHAWHNRGPPSHVRRRQMAAREQSLEARYQDLQHEKRAVVGISVIVQVVVGTAASVR